MRPFICHFLYRVCDFNLVSSAYNVPCSVRSPPSGGYVVVAAQVVEPKDTVEAQPSDEAVDDSGVPVTDAALEAGAATQAGVGGGSLTFKVLPGSATNVTTEEVAADDPASSAGPSGARVSP
jgi:hypothetical protein